LARFDVIEVIVPDNADQASTAPAERLVRTLAGRWTLAVLGELTARGRRYQDLYDALGGISYKVLTETLRRAERDGLIARHLDGERIETATLYELTDLGRSLDEPLAAMAGWADANWQTVEAARSRWDRLRLASG
jgi:DNA-binding HxlR family transcriptional regulator